MSSDSKALPQDALPLPSPSEREGKQEDSVHSAAPREGSVHDGRANDGVSTEGDNVPGESSGILAEGTAEISKQSARSTVSKAAADVQPLASSRAASQDSKGAASAMSCRSETDAYTAHIERASAAESTGMPVSGVEGSAKQMDTSPSTAEAQAGCAEAAGVEGSPQDVHEKSEQSSTNLHKIGGESRAASVHEKAQKVDRGAKGRCSIS